LAARSSPPVDLLDAPVGASVVRGGALRGGVYLVGIALSLVSVPLMTRHLGAVDYGRVLAVFSLIAVAGALTDGGLTTVGVREYSVRSSDEHRALLRAILGLRVVLTVAGIAGACLFAMAVGYPAVLVGGTLLAGAGLFAGSVQKVLTVPLAASLRLGTMASLNLFEQVALVAFVVVLVIGDAGMLPFFTIYLWSGLAALAATVAVAGRMPSPGFDVSLWRVLWRDMLPYGAATAISATGVVLIAMPLLGSDLDVGYFAIAAQVVTVLIGVWVVISASTLPVLARAARDDHDRLRNVLERTIHATFVIGVGVSVLTLVGADLAIRLLAGPEFEPATEVLQILAPTLAVGYLVSVWTLTLLALRRVSWVLAVNGAALIVTLGLALLLVPAHGSIGGAIAVLVGQMLSVPGFAVGLGRNDLGLGEPRRLLSAVALAAGLSVLAGMLLPVPKPIAVIVAAGLYAGVLLLLGAIPPELRDLLTLRSRPMSREA
jgi:O-antigen/teichoic acid export membrane protein